jgi:hypothetical protein
MHKPTAPAPRDGTVHSERSRQGHVAQRGRPYQALDSEINELNEVLHRLAADTGADLLP